MGNLKASSLLNNFYIILLAKIIKHMDISFKVVYVVMTRLEGNVGNEHT